MTGSVPSGPLAGVKVVHLASLGPGPYAAMLLADLGCDVIVVDRTAAMMVSMPQAQDPRRRGQRSIALDLKQPEGLEVLFDLIRNSDVLIEGMRPGAAERMGAGPEVCFDLNPRLVYARVTGWGQTGPLADRAGHDINYIALSGALHAMGSPGEPPPVPLNLLGDYAAGGVFVVTGILAALYERQQSGLGQVVDGAIIDGVGSLTAATMGMLGAGLWGARGTNVFDGSAPWYRTYATRDGGFVAVGAIEPQFYRELLVGLGLDPAAWSREDRSRWPEIADRFAEIFRSKDRDHWEQKFAGSDACVSPVISFEEAVRHPHHVARGTYLGNGRIFQPAPAPRLSRSRAPEPGAPPAQGAHTDSILHELGRSSEEITRLRAEGAAG